MLATATTKSILKSFQQKHDFGCHSFPKMHQIVILMEDDPSWSKSKLNSFSFTSNGVQARCFVLATATTKSILQETGMGPLHGWMFSDASASYTTEISFSVTLLLWKNQWNHC